MWCFLFIQYMRCSYKKHYNVNIFLPYMMRECCVDIHPLSMSSLRVVIGSFQLWCPIVSKISNVSLPQYILAYILCKFVLGSVDPTSLRITQLLFHLKINHEEIPSFKWTFYNSDIIKNVIYSMSTNMTLSHQNERRRRKNRKILCQNIGLKIIF